MRTLSSTGRALPWMRRACWAVSMATLTIVVALAPLGVPAADAAELDAIRSVTIVGSRAINTGTFINVEVAWAVPSSARAGDTFSLKLPTTPVINGVSGSFDLTDPVGQTAGNCVVTKPQIICTLNKYVNGRADLHGTLHFYAQAQAPSDSGEVSFTSGTGAAYTVSIPGGHIGVGNISTDYPDRAFNRGRVNSADKTTEWSIYVPGNLMMRDRRPITITDTYDPALGPLIPTMSAVKWSTAAQWADAAKRWEYLDQQHLDPGAFQFTDNAAAHTFTFTVTDPSVIVANRLYVVTFGQALPESAKDGDVVKNSATTGVWTVGDQRTYWAAGGTAVGADPRTIEITEKATGPGHNDPGPMTFTVACADEAGEPVPGFPQSQDASAAQKATFAGVPVDSTCTMTQQNPQGAQVSYSTVNPIKVTSDAPLTISVVATSDSSQDSGDVTPCLDPADPMTFNDQDCAAPGSRAAASGANAGVGSAVAGGQPVQGLSGPGLAGLAATGKTVGGSALFMVALAVVACLVIRRRVRA